MYRKENNSSETIYGLMDQAERSIRSSGRYDDVLMFYNEEKNELTTEFYAGSDNEVQYAVYTVSPAYSRLINSSQPQTFSVSSDDIEKIQKTYKEICSCFG